MKKTFGKNEVLKDISAIFLLLAFAAVICFNVWYSSFKRKEQYHLLDDPFLDKSFLGYYLWRAQNYHHGKDIRIYRVKPLIKQKLQKDNAAKCARMAKIRLTPQETAQYEQQMQELFGWVQQLSEVDTSGVDVSAAAGAAYLRPDEPITDAPLAQTLVGAFNEQLDHCAKVKKVL